MSYTKRWLEDCSFELGHDGEINDEVMDQASPARCPRAWQRAIDRAPRPDVDVETGPRVILLHMPVCHHGYRSGWAYAQVDGTMRRLHTSQSDRIDYCRHRGEVIELFAAGNGETY